MRKKIFVFTIALFTIVGTANAQFLRFGVKGGVSSSNVKFDKTTLTAVSTTSGAKNFLIEQGNSQLGIHFGLFGRIQLLGLYIQPEVLFTQTKGELLITDQTASTLVNKALEQKFNKIDVPIIVGWKFGPARFGLGPVASIALSEKDGLKDKLQELAPTGTKAVSNFKNATFGYQVSVGLDVLKKLTLDVKYEGNLSKLGSGLTLGGNNYKFDQRNPQWIFSLGIFF